MGKRVPANPPTLAGFKFVKLIGSGGYADVFLYEQQMPRQQVAVKVLDPGAAPGGGGKEMFAAEANLMAKVSAHPYIVPVFQAGISRDGRPYLIMAYYSGPNYYDRARSEQISVAETLRVGVQLASAVETAHRAGILHRDIKPANVLTNEYNRPGLTDFGIASAQEPGVDTADGVSIPWSSPEALGEAPADQSADVYALAATVYTLLAGRAPFEIPGGDNRPLAMIGRIERHPLPSFARADVPGSLMRVLATAMAKDPSHRPPSAAALGRQLQGIETELNLATTLLELAADPSTVRARIADDDDEDSTRVKGVTEVRAQDDPQVAITSVPLSPDGGAPVARAPRPVRRREGMLSEPEISDTVMRPKQAATELPELAPPAGIPKLWLVAIGIVVVIGLAVGGVVLRDRGEPAEAEKKPTFDALEVNDNIGNPVAVTPPALKVVEAEKQASGPNVFTWEDRGAGVRYAVTPEGSGSAEVVESPRFESYAKCVEVEVIGGNDRVSAATRGCIPE